MIKQLFNSFIVLLAVSFGLVSCGSEEVQEKVSKRYVKVKRLDTTQAAEELIFNGQLKEKKEVDVAFKVGGQVLEVLVDEGDRVHKGQVIARIDPRDYKIRLQAAKAQYEQLKSEFTRYQELYKKNKLPINTLEKLEAGYLAAKSAYENAQNALNDTQLKAPFEGYVYRKNTNKYENVAPGQPIYVLLDVSHLEVLFSLPESKVNKAKNFSSVKVDVPNANRFGLEAVMLSVNEKANGNDMFDVRLKVNAGEEALKPGMSAKVRISLAAAQEQLITVPVEAVFNKDQATYVWVYDQNKSVVSSRKVSINKIDNAGKLIITSGLTGNELVVTAGVHSLIENQAVRVLTDTNI
ncbi:MULTISPECIES: efflux RND transporter periplasmic adaptor subunit [unclassified Carboxylicivirga]|uniref:efflux RND transporter periplasmic adaptor subunit n=1 Tax=Carboxylicivirga TaxID=1628153 RepID=UPI003D3526BF